MRIRRKSLFYVYNLILPCILLAMLTTFSFSLPPGSGERIALVITILLGLTVYMLIFTENIPQTSEVVPLISKFFVAVLLEVAMCLLATSGTLRCYHYSETGQDMSAWLRFIIFDCLASLLCMKIKNSQTRRNNSSSSLGGMKLMWQYPGISSAPEDIRQTALQHGVERKFDEILNKLSDMHSYLEQSIASEMERERWHFAAMVIDRFFLYLSAISFVVLSLIFYAVIPRYEGDDVAGR